MDHYRPYEGDQTYVNPSFASNSKLSELGSTDNYANNYVSCSVGISPTLLTVLGFVVGLSLSFRSSTAYERYAEGRRYWAQLILASQNLGRVFWVHSTGRKDVPEEHRDIVRRREVLEKL